MRNLLVADDSLEFCSVLITDFAKPRLESFGVIKVAAFEPHPHECGELQWRLTTCNPLPKPIAHREVAESEPESFEMPTVQCHVADLVQTDT